MDDVGGVMVDTLADALVNMKNCEMVGKKSCEIKPASKVIGSILRILQREGYIGNFEFVDDGKAGIYKVELLGKINNCRAIKPRYSVTKNEYTKWEKRYLPARGFGLLFVSSPRGIITHIEAKQMNTGGKLIGLVY
jgi:small subunit ribosomal protein S8